MRLGVSIHARRMAEIFGWTETAVQLGRRSDNEKALNPEILKLI